MKKMALLAVPFLAVIFPGFAKAGKISISGPDKTQNPRNRFQTEQNKEIFKNLKAGIHPDFFNGETNYKGMMHRDR